MWLDRAVVNGETIGDTRSRSYYVSSNEDGRSDVYSTVHVHSYLHHLLEITSTHPWMADAGSTRVKID